MQSTNGNNHTARRMAIHNGIRNILSTGSKDLRKSARKNGALIRTPSNGIPLVSPPKYYIEEETCLIQFRNVNTLRIGLRMMVEYTLIDLNHDSSVLKLWWRDVCIEVEQDVWDGLIDVLPDEFDLLVKEFDDVLT